MENPCIRYQQILRSLEYDTEINKVINIENRDIDVQLIHTVSKDPFTKYFISLSEKYKQHMVTLKTDPKIRAYSFKCSRKGCQMRVVFRSRKGVLYLNEKKTIFEHSEEAHVFSGRRKYRMTESTYQDFKKLNEVHGSIDQFLLTHQELKDFPRTIFYNNRTIMNREANDVNNIIKNLEVESDFRSKIIKSRDGVVVGCTIINKYLARTNYCDVLVVDDTVGVLSLNYPIEIVVFRDPNGRVQLLGFGLISSKETEAFEDFFKGFKELLIEERQGMETQNEVGKIIVCDRLKSQTNGILKVFTDSLIIYCKVHLKRNFSNAYPNNEKINKLFNNMLESRTAISEKIFLETYKKFPQTNFKKQLVSDYPHFLPSYVDSYYHRGNLTSNNSETTFKVLKESIERKSQPIMAALSTLMDMSRRWIHRTNYEEVKLFPFIVGKVPNNIGKWAVSFLEKEIDNVKNVKEDDVCKCSQIYHLPCRHVFMNNIKTQIEIPKEYLRMDCTITETKNDQTPCVVEEVELETKILNLRNVVNELCSMEGTEAIRNELAYRGMQFIKYKKFSWKLAKKLGFGGPTQKKLSKNCDKRRIFKLKLDKKKARKK